MEVIPFLPPPLNNVVVFTVVVGFLLLIMLLKFTSTLGTEEPKKGTDHLTQKVSPRQTSMTKLPQFQTKNPNNFRGNERRTSIVGESTEAEELDQHKERIVHPKTEQARARIAEITSNHLLFKNLDRQQKEEIFDAMVERKVLKDEVIIQQGDEGDYFYVTDTGHFDIFIDNVKVGEAEAGKSFGELALLYSQPRAATVKATEDSSVWAVDRKTFRRIVLASNIEKRKRYQQFLKEVQILSNLNSEELLKAADALEQVSYSPKEPIITEGEFGDTFYIIEEGTVEIKSKGKILSTKSKGDYFGEIALLTDGFRIATVEAKSQVECLVLDKNAFVRLLGPCNDILKRNMSTYEQYKSMAS